MDRSFLLLIVLLVGFVAVQAIVAVLFFTAVASSFLPFDPTMPPEQPTPEEVFRLMLPGLLVSQAADIVLAGLVGLLLYFLVVALLPAGWEPRLRLGGILFVAGSATGFAVFAVLLLTGNLTLPAFEGGPPLTFPTFTLQYQDVAAGLTKGALQSGAAFLFWRSYRATHRAVAEASRPSAGASGA